MENNQNDFDRYYSLKILRTSLAKWRVLAIVFFIFAISSIGMNNNNIGSISLPSNINGLNGGNNEAKVKIADTDHIAVINLNGVIFRSSYRTKVLNALIDDADKKAKALLVVVNSPGGVVAPSENIMLQIKKFQKSNRPVAIVMQDLAASGGYIVSMVGDRIFAGNNTITGSIGAIAQWYQVDELINKYGIYSSRVVSGDLKGGVDPTAPPDQKRTAEMQKIIDEIRDWFLSEVKKNRKISDENIKAMSDGRVMRGTTAVKFGLVDEIGDIEDAKSWLINNYNLDKNIGSHKYSLTPPEKDFISKLVTQVKTSLGFPNPAEINPFLKNTSGFWTIWEGTSLIK